MAHCRPDQSNFSTQYLPHSFNASEASTRAIAYYYNKARKHIPSYFSMPRNSDTVKAANLRRAKSKAKVIEWESRVHSRGVRDVPVEVSTAASRPMPRKRAYGELRAESANELPHETAFQPMDIDETLLMEEPVMLAGGKKVRQPE
jgi:hypothetical protein